MSRRPLLGALALAAVLLAGCGGDDPAPATPTRPPVTWDDEMTIVTATPPSPGGRVTYVVQSGDSLAIIAARYGITERALAAANAITDPNQIMVGQELVIPVPAAATSPSATARP